MRSLSQELQTLPPEQLLRPPAQQELQIVESDHLVQIIRVLLPEAIHNQALSPLITDVLQEVITSLSDYFATKMELGELRQSDSLLVAQTFISSIMGFVLRRQVLHDPLALQYTQEQIA